MRLPTQISNIHVPIKISIYSAKINDKAPSKIFKRCMKNFTATRWNQTLEQFNFESDTVNINEQAINLSNQINAALDIICYV